jgi:hypothetical protein
MKKARFADEQIIGILREHDAGRATIQHRPGGDLPRLTGSVLICRA